ncbi:MAG: glycosyltransferase family 1 protein [Chitinophagaceae bacterium]|nr:glycosyltransferase family 1 protein [Anaerolineae bacterium]
MHISIFVYGTWGDIRPHVVLGMALQKAGHEVQVVASQGYEKWVRARNLGFYPLTTDVSIFAKENASIMDAGIIEQLQTARKVLNPILAQMGLEVLKATRESDVLMTVEFGVSLLFDVLRVNNLKTILINPAPLNPTSEVSFATMPSAPNWFPFSQGYNRFTYSIVQRLQWSVLGGARNELATKHLGLPKSKLRDFQTMLAATPALTTVSKHVFNRPTDWPEHFQVTGYLFDDEPEWTPPQELTDFLEAGEAPIYIGFGSMPDSKPEATTRTLIDAVQQASKRAVILKGWAGLGADNVPENIHILNYAPHSWLFPRMSAVIHHGGAGTTASGFRAGVPTVIIPHNADQPYWGRRVTELGVGAQMIPRKKLTVETLHHAIKTVTEDSRLRENAQILGRKIQQEDGLTEAVKWVEHYLKPVMNPKQ